MYDIKKILAGLLLLTASASAFAADTKSSDEWHYGAQIYLWGAAISGTTAGGNSIDIPFSTIIDNLDFAGMFTLGARKEKWSLYGDFIYMNLTSDDIKQGRGPIPTSLGVGMKSWVINVGGGYAIADSEKTRLELIGGARYLWLKGTLKLNVGEQAFRPNDSGDNWDAIVGLRGETELSDKWYLNYEADVGTGDSDLTWQATATAGYRFKKVDIVGGYRYLNWEFDDSSPLRDITIKGPYAGVRFTW